MPCRAFLVAIAVSVCAPALPAAAQTPSKPELAARLHKRALTAAKRGRVDEAMHLWEEAEALHPSWKYAFNLANLAMQGDKWMDAWNALVRARTHGVPPEHTERVSAAEKRARTALLADHALLQLQIEPEDARVKVGADVWSAPFEGWVKGDSSLIRVSSPGHDAIERKVSHQAGAVYRESFRLQPTARAPSKKGALKISGSPNGAMVLLNGKTIGRLPSALATDLAPGRYTVYVSAEGHSASQVTIAVAAGKTATAHVTLAPKVEAPTPEPAKGNGFAPWGWGALGVGVATAAAGIPMYLDVIEIHDEAIEIDGKISRLEHTDADLARKAELKNDFTSTYPTAVALFAVGGVVAATGIVLLILHEPDEDPVTVAPLIGPGTLGATLTF